ncbi:hypothetical protein NC652_027762 [Populus alba x Populus x berolinensis]|nr:hypothetical protein NC652_027762 [Populus alba x Populus x berolinensis]
MVKVSNQVLMVEIKRSGEDKQAAGEKGEQRGTTLVFVRRVVELGLLKLRWRRNWVCSG